MKKLLVIVDMQNDFIDGVLGSPEAQTIVPKVIERMKQAFEDEDEFICFTKDTHDAFEYPLSEEGKNLPIPHCLFPSEGWKINKEIIECTAHDHSVTELYFIWKKSFGHNWEKESWIHDYQIGTIEIIGLDTDFCVLANAMTLKATFPNAHIVINAACCAGSTPEWHEKALDMLEHCHCEIINRG